MSEGSLAGTMVRLVLSLATVLTLMLLLARYLRHRQHGTGFAKATTQGRKQPLPLQVLTRQGLSRGSSVAVGCLQSDRTSPTFDGTAFISSQ